MERVEHRIKLNLMKAGLQGQVIVKKADSDSRKINIYLSSAAGPFNMSDIASAILRAEKPDGKVMFNSCIVCKDRLEYIITTQTIAATGTVTCEITLTSKSGQVLVTPRFEIIVADIIYSDSEIESTNEYTALEEAIKKAAALKDGTTFTPHVSDEGVLSWTNADGKDNPAAVNIKGPPGRDGADGSPGAAGADGVTPHIGDNGNWFIGSTDTGKPSRGEKGDPGKDGADGGSGTPGVGDVTPIIGENGNWFVGNTDTGKPSRGEKGDPGKDGVDGSPGAAGADGVTPTIGDNGNWFIGNTDTGKPSRGADGAKGVDGTDGKDGANGKDGSNGITPRIGTNGNWYLGDTDTGKPSRGDKGADGKDGVDGSPGAAGADGITPHIGDNGNWFVGNTDTGKPSRGATGAKGSDGANGKDGAQGEKGADGKTPVRGTDYWTTADKQEIVNSVIAALPDGTEVSY